MRVKAMTNVSANGPWLSLHAAIWLLTLPLSGCSSLGDTETAKSVPAPQPAQFNASDVDATLDWLLTLAVELQEAEFTSNELLVKKTRNSISSRLAEVDVPQRVVWRVEIEGVTANQVQISSGLRTEESAVNAFLFFIDASEEEAGLLTPRIGEAISRERASALRSGDRATMSATLTRLKFADGSRQTRPANRCQTSGSR